MVSSVPSAERKYVVVTRFLLFGPFSRTPLHRMRTPCMRLVLKTLKMSVTFIEIYVTTARRNNLLTATNALFLSNEDITEC